MIFYFVSLSAIHFHHLARLRRNHRHPIHAAARHQRRVGPGAARRSSHSSPLCGRPAQAHVYLEAARLRHSALHRTVQIQQLRHEIGARPPVAPPRSCAPHSACGNAHTPYSRWPAWPGPCAAALPGRSGRGGYSHICGRVMLLPGCTSATITPAPSAWMRPPGSEYTLPGRTS